MMKIQNIKALSSRFLLLITAFGFLYSCELKEEYLGELSPYIALEDLRALHKGTDVALNKETLTGASIIYGTVISDHTEGNVPEGTIIIQQNKRNRTRGMAIQVGQSAADYKPGDSIVVNIENTMLTRNGFLTVRGIKADQITKVSSGNFVKMITTTAAAINSTPQNFESTLIRVIGGQMYPKPTTDETFLGSKLMINGADTVNIVTQSTANFATTHVPRNITVSGILLGSPTDALAKNSIYPRYTSDILDVSDPEVPEYIGSTPIIITGFCNDPSGGDANYEYVQLLANTDINFSEVPFSLVVSNNAGSVLHTAGWASGGARTFKFNLREGSVKKGEYFYVGGEQKRINGANSTKIEQLNWIRTILYGVSAGIGFDGFGSPNDNILPNSGNAGGIALFIGTNVSEASVPIDVIFFGGTGLPSIISPDKTLGYRIANTDHYSMYDATSGDLTPFFSMGGDAKTNDFRFPHHGGPTNTDRGYFYQLGGKFNAETRKWETARSHTIIFLDKGSNANLLETGTGTTEQVN